VITGSPVKDPHLVVSARAEGEHAMEIPGTLGFLVTLARYSWFVTLFALVVAAAVAVKTLREGRVYAAESAFMLDSDRPLTNVSGLAAQFGIAVPPTGDAQSPNFYADLLKSPALLRRVVDTTLQVNTPTGVHTLRLVDSVPDDGNPALRREFALQKLSSRIGVSTAPRTGVVTLRVLDPSPDVALAINQELLRLAEEFNRSRRRGRAMAERSFIEERLDSSRDSLRFAEERLRRFLSANRAFLPSSEAFFERQRLEREVGTRSQVYVSLLQSHEQAKLEEFRDAPLLAVVQSAERPAAPQPRRTARKTVIGFLIGLVAALFIAYVIEGVRQLRLRHPAAGERIGHAFHEARGGALRPWRLLRGEKTR
jgi:uncharacterized protein involved in exopolysaccharide biosynthesis